MQWAAVSTTRGAITAPEQNATPARESDTTAGTPSSRAAAVIA